MKLAQFTTPEATRTSGENPPITLPPLTNLDWAARAAHTRQHHGREPMDAATIARWHARVEARNVANARERKLAAKRARAHRKPTRSHVDFLNDILSS
jgi:hypothetical protein